MQARRSFSRRIFPLCTVRTLGVFNSNAFKVLAFLIICSGVENPLLNPVLVSVYALCLAAMCVVPALAAMAPAGFLADRLPKRYVIILSGIAEMLLLLAAFPVLRNCQAGGTWPIACLMIALAFQNMFSPPALAGILPEVFHESELSHANGTLNAFSLFGAVAGIAFVPFYHFALKGPFDQIIRILAACSLLGIIASFYITQTISVVQMHRELVYSFRSSIVRGWREIRRTSGLLLAALGDALFISLGLAVLILLGFFGAYSLSQPFSAFDNALLRLAPVLGLALGCYLAGKICSKKIELGLVPFGAAGLALFLLLGAYVPGAVHTLEVRAGSGGEPFLIRLCWPGMLWFFLAGINGGLFLIPLRAFFQQRVRPAARGAAIAAANVLIFGMVFLINLLYLALVIGYAKDTPELAGTISRFPAVSPKILLTSIGFLTFCITLFTMWRLPDFALRFLFLSLGHVFYRIRVRGAENIPERGPALLLANHTSFIDNILISSCTSRPIRFLMQEEFFDKPQVHWIVRLTGFIKVPSSGKYKSIGQMFELVQQALRNGEIVCVFPEGTPTRNGIVGKFSGSFEHMLPEGLNVPVIPVNVGRIWGSIFSYFYGPIRLRMPKAIPYFASISIGTPLPKGISAFDVRQKITELAAEEAQLEIPHEHPVHYFLAKNAKLHPFQVIMRDAADGKSFTFFKTYLAAILFSREIRKMTPSDSKYVGVLLPNSTAAVISIMGCLLADKVPCPLNFTTSQEILELSIRKAKIKLVLTNRLFLTKVRLTPTPEMVFLEDVAKRVPMWKKIMTMLSIILIPYKELINMLAPLTHDDNNAEAVLLFSSGTTGIPKGVRLTHHNLFADVFAETQAISFDPKRDGIFGNLPLFHSFGINTGLWLPFIIRSRPVIYVHSPLDAALIGDAIVKYKVPILVATPSFLQTYLRKFKPEVFDVLRLVVSGAEKLRSDVAENFHRAVGGKLEIVEGYGCTELSPVVTFNMALNGQDTGRICGKKGAIGQGLETVCTRIMDPLSFKPVAPDAEGLLFIKGPMVMQGYLDDPEQSAKVLLDGYYNTGDIAKMDEHGFVTICGRLSRFSKIAGEMVPHEMVECIINELCGLENRVVAVSCIPDAQKGEALLVLYTPETPLTPDQIVAELRERSISNLWIPKASNFEPVDSLPILGSGKLDLQVLHRLADEVAAKRQALAGQKKG